MYAKGDVKQSSQTIEHNPLRFLFELKTTVAQSLRIQGAWLGKITREASAEGLEPAFEFEIDGYKDPMCEKSWVAVPRSVFIRLQHFAQQSVGE